MRRAVVYLLAFVVYFQASFGVALASRAMADPFSGFDFGLCSSLHDDAGSSTSPETTALPGAACEQCVACVFAHAGAPIDLGPAIASPVFEGLAVSVRSGTDAPREFLFPSDFDARGPPIA